MFTSPIFRKDRQVDLREENHRTSMLVCFALEWSNPGSLWLTRSVCRTVTFVRRTFM